MPALSTVMFDGHIPHTPIVVDDFAPSVLTSHSTPLIFLLSHYHTDHVRGLSASFNRGPIYTSRITKALVLVDLPQLRPYLQALSLDERHTLNVGGMTVHLTLLDAYHCPGSVMFLLHFPSCPAFPVSHTALHTGDCRYSPLTFHSPLLHAAINSVHTLYLDATFLHPSTPTFPSKPHAQRIVIALLASYFRSHSSLFAQCRRRGRWDQGQGLRAYVCCDGLGTEDLISAVATYFHLRWYVRDERRRRQLALLKQTCDAVAVDDGKGGGESSTPLHCVAGRGFQQWAARDAADRKTRSAVQALYIKPSAMWFARRGGGGGKGAVLLKAIKTRGGDGEEDDDGEDDGEDDGDLSREDGKEEVEWGNDGKDGGDECSEYCARDGFGVHHVLWSMHSSMTEAVEFIQFINPRTVVPLCAPALTPQLYEEQDEGVEIEAEGGAKAEPQVKDERVTGVKRRVSRLFAVKESRRDRDRAVCAAIQHYISALLPDRRIVVSCPSLPYPKDEDRSELLSHPAPAAKVQRVYSSPSKLQSAAAAASSSSSDRVLDRIVRANATAKKEEQAAGSSGVAGAMLPTNRALFPAPPPRAQSEVVPSPAPLPGAPMSRPTRPFVVAGLTVTPLRTPLFDFSRLPIFVISPSGSSSSSSPAPPDLSTSMVYIARDIRSEQRAALSRRLAALRIPPSPHLIPSTRLVLMRWGRASTRPLFEQLLRRVARIIRDRHREQSGQEAVEVVWVYQEAVVDELESVTRRMALEGSSAWHGWTQRENDRVGECMLWSSAQLSRAKVDELLRP